LSGLIGSCGILWVDQAEEKAFVFFVPFGDGVPRDGEDFVAVDSGMGDGLGGIWVEP